MKRTRTRRTTLTVAAFGLVTALAACGQTESPTGTEPTTEDVQETTAPVDDDDATTDDDASSDDGSTVTDDDAATQIPNPNDPGEAGIPLGPVDESISSREDVQTAIADEAERSSVSPEEVTIAGYADVTWPNGAIGCETEGMMYTQALVPGHLLILEVAGEYLNYHAAQGKPFAYCAQPSPPTSVDSGAGGTSDM